MEALRAAMSAETGVAKDETLQMFFRLGYAAPIPARRLDGRSTASSNRDRTAARLPHRQLDRHRPVGVDRSEPRAATDRIAAAAVRDAQSLQSPPGRGEDRDLGRPGAAAAAARSHQDRAEAGRQGLAARNAAARATVAQLLALTPAGLANIVRLSGAFPVSSAPSPAGHRTIAVRCSRCSTA